MWSKKALATLDEHFPPCGPCGFCGGKDARHRLWDALLDRRAAGEGVKALAADYGLPVAAVRRVLRVRPYHRGGSL